MNIQDFAVYLAETFKNNPEELLRFLVETSGNRLEERKTYLAIGAIGYELSNVGYSGLGLFLNEKALEYFIKVNDLEGKGAIHITMGLVYYRLGEFEKANDYSHKALDIFIRTGSISDQITCYINLGSSYNELGEFTKVIELQREVLEKTGGSGDDKEKLKALGACYGNLANAYRGLGELSKALEYQNRSLQIAIGAEDRVEAAANYVERGETYRLLGSFNEALRDYQRGLEIAIRLNYKGFVASCYSNIGIIYRRLGDFEKAIDAHKKALKVREEIGDKDGIAKSCTNLGNAYGDLRDFPTATNYYQNSLKYFLEVGNKARLGEIYASLGVTYKDSGDSQKAIECHKIASEYAEGIGDKVLQSIIYHNFGNHYFQNFDYQKALEFTKKSLSLVGRIKEVLAEENVSLRFLRSKISTYELGINSAVKLHEEKGKQDYLRDCLEIIERTKARELVKRLSITRKEDLPLRPNYEKLDGIEHQIRVLTAKVKHSPTLDALYGELDALYTEKVKVIDEIYLKSIDPSSLIPSVDLNLVELFWERLKNYEDNCSVLEMYLQRERILYLLFDNIEYRLFIQQVTDELIEKAYTYLELEKEYKRGHPTNVEKFYATLDGLVNRLFPQELIGELSKLRFQDLFIIPHRWLHQIAWEGAVIAGTPLGVKYNLTRHYSLDLVRSSLRSAGEVCRNAMIASNPTLDLSGADMECKVANQKLKRYDKDFFIGAEARLAAIRESLPKVSIAHFACHGSFDLKSPFKSQLNLNDQSLIASDIALMTLKCSPFIFLNACETGQAGGKTEERLEDIGDEQLGFVRAFAMAGASTMVVTGWTISDKVAEEFAENFYSAIEANSVSKALRIARMLTYNKYKDQSRDWASYTLYGNPFKRL